MASAGEVRRPLFWKSGSVTDGDLSGATVTPYEITNGTLGLSSEAGSPGAAASTGPFDFSGGSVIGLPSLDTPCGTTALAIGSDPQNWYRIRRTGNELIFESNEADTLLAASIRFVAKEQRYWRLRHDSTHDLIVFETSRNGTSWIRQHAITRRAPIVACQAELFVRRTEGDDGPCSMHFTSFRLNLRP